MHYKIIEEVILEEKGHIYEIIVADYFEQQTQTLTKSEIKFGPILLKRNMNYFLKMGKRTTGITKIKDQLNTEKHRERLNEINNEINLINEVL